MNEYRVLKGTALLSPNVLAAARALLKRETPDAWLKQWDGPVDAMQWLRALVTKATALLGWLDRAKDGSLLAKVLSGFLVRKKESCFAS